MIEPSDIAAFSNGAVASSDPRLQGAIDGAYAVIATHCGWHVTPELEQTWVLDTDGGSLITLPTLHLSDVTVSIDDEEIDDYEWSSIGTLKRRCGWPNAYRAVTVEATHGFDDVPVIDELVKTMVLRHVMSPTGAIREQAGAIAVTWAMTAPNSAGGLVLLEPEKASLTPYRLP